MHGRMHPNYCQITLLLLVDLCSSLAYFMMTQPLPITGKKPIKTLVARQLPTNTCTLTHTLTHTHTHTLTEWTTAEADGPGARPLFVRSHNTRAEVHHHQ